MKEHTRLWLLAAVDIFWTIACGILFIQTIKYDFVLGGPEIALWARLSSGLLTASWLIRMIVNLSRIEEKFTKK